MAYDSVRRNRRVELGRDDNDLSSDVWGVAKTTKSFSLFRSLFTYGIPGEEWRYSAGTNSSIYANDGQLVLDSGTATDGGSPSNLLSRTHSRYQSNRGHLFSTASQNLDTGAGVVFRWGLFTDDEQVFFEWNGDDNKLYAVLKTTRGVIAPDPEDHSDGGGTLTEIHRAEVVIPPDVDITVNTLWDLRFQWRGAGDFEFMVNQRVLHRISRLQIENTLSLTNPGVPAAFQVENTGAGSSLTMKFGCVDVSSEGGNERKYTPRATGLDESRAINGTNIPIVAFQIAPFLGGRHNTRDCLALAAFGGGDQRAVVKVWRNPTVVGGSWAPWDTEAGKSGVRVNTTATSITGGELIAVKQAVSNESAEFSLKQLGLEFGPAPGAVLVEGDPSTGDTFVVTVQRDNSAAINVLAGLTIGEEV